MARNYYRLINKYLSGKIIFILLILTNMIYITMLSITIPLVMRFANGMKLLDMLPTGYNAQYVYSLLSALGRNGRNAYLCTQIPLDMIYPGLFAISYGLLLGYILKNLGKLDGSFSYLCLLPVFAGLFDYAENIGIISLLKTYPQPHTSLVNLTAA